MILILETSRAFTPMPFECLSCFRIQMQAFPLSISSLRHFLEQFYTYVKHLFLRHFLQQFYTYVKHLLI
ncbi:hypothetical protein CISIN_1g044852mg [Citrus sinensis]|uniref:Uncharacterized protein n=1 Tax=Citrus sinensis TaxID=2711 RepID=A0A067DM43_CITSI|nr:hypothetical protein CISIN_1g044852mg [Citrus sinensis]